MKLSLITFLLCGSFVSLYSQSVDSVRIAKSDSAKVYELKEVVATSENIVHKLGYDLLILGKDNKKFGTNALDAISTLNEFESSLNDTKLTTWDKTEVLIVINGVPSSGYELRGYKVEDVKSIKYYRVPPAQYLTMTSGPVIDVIIKNHKISYIAVI